MESIEKKPSVQEVALFLRDAAYSQELYLHTHSLFVTSPRDANGDVVYQGGLHTHTRVIRPPHIDNLVFSFTKARGIYDLTASRDSRTVLKTKDMAFSAFQVFVMELFEIERLYDPSHHPGLYKSRPVKNPPSLQEVAEFMEDASNRKNDMGVPLGWLLHVLHPYDNNGDLGYSGGLWTAHPLNAPFPESYCSISFSYSKTCGIYDVRAWKSHCSVCQKKRISFEDFQSNVLKLFSTKV